jgi:hypothetical protein
MPSRSLLAKTSLTSHGNSPEASIAAARGEDHRLFVAGVYLYRCRRHVRSFHGGGVRSVGA